MDEEKKEGEEDIPRESDESVPKKFEEPPKEPSKEFPKESSKSSQNLTHKLRKNPWVLSTFVFGMITLILLVTSFSGNMTGKVVSGEEVGNNVLDFASSQLTDMEILGIEEEYGFYKIKYTSKETDESFVYATLDGKYLVNGLIPLKLEDVEDSSSNTPEQVENIPKSDKPVVELFVMTHCPYGTQAEKGLIPVIEALGNNVNAKIRFVHYFMHDPEEEETSRQVCIREEQSEKWLNYLRCFLEDGDANRCLTETGINQAELDDCIANRAEAYYAEDSALSEGYGVQGSPTLIVNGQIVSSARSPAAYLDTICQAFNDIPAECDNVLSTTTPSSMWGWDASGAETAAQC